MFNCQLPMHNCQLPMLNCQCQLPTKLSVAKTPISIGSANCQQNWQLLKRQLSLAVETANRNWRQFWSQPRLKKWSHPRSRCAALHCKTAGNYHAARRCWSNRVRGRVRCAATMTNSNARTDSNVNQGEFTQYPFFVRFCLFFYLFASPSKRMHFFIRIFICPYPQ